MEVAALRRRQLTFNLFRNTVPIRYGTGWHYVVRFIGCLTVDYCRSLTTILYLPPTERFPIRFSGY